MLITIRDDDLSFFTKPNDLEMYSRFLGKIPIGFAAVPFIHNMWHMVDSDVPGDSKEEKIRNLRDYESSLGVTEFQNYFMKYFAIGANESIITMLKLLIKSAKAEIMMHGLTHRYFPDGPEMKRDHVSFSLLQTAKDYLEKLFETDISTFVPPSNTIDYVNLRKVGKLEMVVFSDGLGYYSGTLDKLRRRILFYSNPKTLRMKLAGYRNYAWRIHGVAIIQCCSFGIGYTKDVFLAKHLGNMEKNGFGVIATHYSNLRLPVYRDEFFKLIEHFIGRGDEFVLPSELLRRAGLRVGK